MTEKRNALGQTEEEFLASYDASKFERPSVTVDMVIFCENKVLLIKRANHPFIDTWALPGGFVEPNETCEQAATRELMEETGVRAYPKQLKVYSDPKRDPRTRIITVAFTQVLEKMPKTAAGDDAADAKWFNITFLADGSVMLKNGPAEILLSPEGKSADMASDHGIILTDGIKKHYQ